MISLVLSKRGSYRYHNKRKIPINGLFVPFMGKSPSPCGERLYYRLNHLYTAYRSVVTFLCIFIQADAKRNVNRVPLKKVLFKLFFGFAFSCYLIVIAFQKHRLTRAHREKQLKMSCQALHNAPPNRT